jgi:hypothetical protein
MKKALAPHLMSAEERTNEIAQLLADACICLNKKRKKQDSTGVSSQTERSCEQEKSTKNHKDKERL